MQSMLLLVDKPTAFQPSISFCAVAHFIRYANWYLVFTHPLFLWDELDCIWKHSTYVLNALHQKIMDAWKQNINLHIELNELQPGTKYRFEKQWLYPYQRFLLVPLESAQMNFWRKSATLFSYSLGELAIPSFLPSCAMCSSDSGKVCVLVTEHKRKYMF